MIGWLFSTVGRSVEKGNNLIMDEIHEPGAGIPWRMAPFIFFSTLLTHLCGGSAGREGTAVQMGGSIASGFASLLPRLAPPDVRRLLMAGVAAGFGGVFGTPIAGTVFAMEVLAIGRMSYAALIPCLVASLVSDQTCQAWGVGHTHYHVASLVPKSGPGLLAPLTLHLVACAATCGVLSGLVSRAFAETTHSLQRLFHQFCRSPRIRPCIGGLLIIALTAIAGRDYLGLGVSSPDPAVVSIVSSFEPGGAQPTSWLWKLLFTAITLASGFKGGEVTPLFFIGATLGNWLATVLGAPVDLLAALGFVAVFAGATNTPLACTIMAVELFGGEFIAYAAIACCLAYLFSGHSGIYSSQRIGTSKTGTTIAGTPQELRALRGE